MTDTVSSPGLRPLLEILAGSRVFDLEHPRRTGDPVHPNHFPGHQSLLYRRHERAAEPRTSASAMLVMAEHSGTHIDAFCHQADGLHLLGGLPVTPEVQTPSGFTELGVETVAPVLRRGVLLDVAGRRGARPGPRELIEPDELERARAAAGVRVGPGDVLLVRTGYGALWHDPPAYLDAAGMSAAASRWAIERGVFAVGADNTAWDVVGHVDADLGASLPGHLLLLARAGIHIVENLWLEELAGAGATECLFACFPLKLSGGTGSPVRPVAIVPS
jgi:kynurenine formamidase